VTRKVPKATKSLSAALLYDADFREIEHILGVASPHQVARYDVERAACEYIDAVPTPADIEIQKGLDRIGQIAANLRETWLPDGDPVRANDDFPAMSGLLRTLEKVGDRGPLSRELSKKNARTRLVLRLGTMYSNITHTKASCTTAPTYVGGKAKAADRVRPYSGDFFDICTIVANAISRSLNDHTTAHELADAIYAARNLSLRCSERWSDIMASPDLANALDLPCGASKERVGSALLKIIGEPEGSRRSSRAKGKNGA
jgi:hypothetical protein